MSKRVLESVKVGDSVVPCLVEGDGPLMIFSYALGQVAWGSSLDRLKQRCTVTVLDWLEAAPQPPPPVHLTYSWFPELVRSVGFERGALCTWSMGSPAVVRYATTNPPELSHLILIDPAGFGGLPPRRWRDIAALLSVQIMRRPTRMFVRTMWRNWVRSARVNKRPLEEAHLRFLNSPGVLMRRSGPGLRRRPTGTGAPGSRPPGSPFQQDLLPDLEKIHVPTLVLTGRHSGVLGPDLAATAVSKLPHGSLVIFEESSHSVHLEEPERFQEVVGDFMTGES